jgi:hypothetical protein
MLKTQEPKMLREIVQPETVEIDYKSDILEQLSRQLKEVRITNEEVGQPKKSNEEMAMLLERILTGGLVAVVGLIYYTTLPNDVEQRNDIKQTPAQNIQNLRSDYSKTIRQFL